MIATSTILSYEGLFKALPDMERGVVPSSGENLFE